MPDIRRILAEAYWAKASLEEVILRANIKDSGEARVAASLCLTVAEQFAAALHMFEGGFSTHAPIIIRSMLEGLADLRNIVKDPAYTDQLRFEDAYSNVRLFSAYVNVEAMDQDAIDTLNRWKEKAQPELDELTAKGLKPQTVISKFEQVGMLENYVSYRVLCSVAHSQLTTLLSRHAGRFELRYHDEAPEVTTASILTMALAIMCQAVQTLPVYSDVAECELQKRLDAIDKAWDALST